MREPNPDKLNELVGKLVGDLGAAIAGASILLGDRLGIYKAMADGTPVTSSELAKNCMSVMYVNGCPARRHPAISTTMRTRTLSRSRRSKPSSSPKKAHRLSSEAPSISFSPPTWMSPRSPKLFVPARASVGMSIRSVLWFGYLARWDYQPRL